MQINFGQFQYPFAYTPIKAKNNNASVPAGRNVTSLPNYLLSYYNKISFGNLSMKKNESKSNIKHFAGCMVGGAVGDAFGSPIEFMKLEKIKKVYGEQGLDFLTQDKKGNLGFTDDTQLTMFTADGIIKSALKGFDENSEPEYGMVFNSYRDWYSTCAEAQQVDHGWISNIDGLLSKGGSGKTCMSVLSQDKMGSIEHPINDAKGTGGIMRVAPVGLLYHKNPENAFKVAANCAALTHGNPNAYLSAGVYAAIIANIINGEDLENSIDNAVQILAAKENSGELLALIEKSKSFAKNEEIKPIDAITQLGQGWNGDEALAISIYCVLKTPNDFKQVIMNASNHDGDSDTVASIAGGISGAYLGYDGIPDELVQKLPMKKELIELADDLLNCPNIQKADKKYKIK